MISYGRHLIVDENGSPYMLRLWLGRLRLHVFYRGDNDPDPHDHPWDFWTFPLCSYVEEVTLTDDPVGQFPTKFNTVRAFRLHFRPATYLHRVLHRSDRIGRRVEGRIITLVWHRPVSRRWGFLKHRDGAWCWEHWKSYVMGGGKHAPCEEREG